MVHVKRHKENLIIQSKLKCQAKSYPIFQYTNLITNQEAWLTKDCLGKLMPSKTVGLHKAYICGPAVFMTNMTKKLVTLRVLAANIYSESFEF